MTIKEAALKVMNELVFNEPISQKEIIHEVMKITNYDYESIRGNTFRRNDYISELYENYIKLKIKNRNYFIRGNNEFHHSYNKPNEYFEYLKYLRNNTTYSLTGTDSQELQILDRDKTITVDYSNLIDADLNCNIMSIIEDANYNLDYEGILTEAKITHINALNEFKNNFLLLTYKSSKNDYMIDLIECEKIKETTYLGKNNSTMKIVLFKTI